MKKHTYTTKEIMDALETYGEVTYSYINRKQNNKIKNSTFNAIYFDGGIKDEFGKSELCVTYVGFEIYHPTPISDIIEILNKPIAE